MNLLLGEDKKYAGYFETDGRIAQFPNRAKKA
jgi:hypothetical protein